MVFGLPSASARPVSTSRQPSPATGAAAVSSPASGRIARRELYHFIAGKQVNGASGRFGDVFNPSTGEVQARAPYASADEVRAAIAVAEKAFPAWAAKNPQARARVM